jgi:imidazole glycerol-phosphate synthase subunit HisH
MIAIVDYGMGNLRSVEKALHHLGHAAIITSDPDEIRAADRVIVPGVGAFGAAMANLSRSEPGTTSLKEAVLAAIESGRPFLGICLGMQLLHSESNELGSHAGLGVVPGQVRRFEFNGRAKAEDLKVPHMGWNALRFPRPSPLFEGLADGTRVYFVHSYYCRPAEDAAVTATADHGGEFCAGLSRGNVFATQFHPEKSGDAGLRILDNFARL